MAPGRPRVILGTVAAGLLLCLAAVTVFRDGTMGSALNLNIASQIELPFTSQDDYESIVSRLGPPAGDQWRSSDGIRYRRLWYPQHSFALILTGGRYAVAVEPHGRVIHSVTPLKNLR